MKENQKNENKFVGYEYKTVKVQRDMEPVLSDGYKNFGWKLEKSEPAVVKHVWGPIRVMLAPLAIFPGSPFAKMLRDHKSETDFELKLKRDKNIPRKTELNRLQSQFEAYAKEINDLEASKKSTAAAAAHIVGFIGTVFMGVSVFSYLANMIPLSIFTAVPGFAGWILSYFTHKAVKGSKTKKVAPMIEQQYHKIYEVCEKADGLLSH